MIFCPPLVSIRSKTKQSPFRASFEYAIFSSARRRTLHRCPPFNTQSPVLSKRHCFSSMQLICLSERTRTAVNNSSAFNRNGKGGAKENFKRTCSVKSQPSNIKLPSSREKIRAIGRFCPSPRERTLSH